MINESEKQEIEKLYKLYIIKNKADYEGSTAKYECVINNERGLFKERMSMQSKDNVMEQVAYEIAQLLNVSCCKASCRKSNGIIGSFSRYEVVDLNNVQTYSKLIGKEELFADKLIERTIKLCNNNINTFVKQLYQYIIFDFIMGQHDRHLENLSVYKKKKEIVWYPLYDNGLCCFSTYANDASIDCLKRGFYSSRMGQSDDIIEAIIKYRKTIWDGDLNKLIHYKNLSKKKIYDIIDKADKYNQIGKERKTETANFIFKQAVIIDKINRGEKICTSVN